MDALNDAMTAIPQPVLWAFAGLGALFVGGKALSYLQFVLNVFILSGTNVRSPRLGPSRVALF